MRKMNFEEWDGSDLVGTWHMSIKKDGMRLHKHPDGSITSRNGKPVYNLPKNIKNFEVAEVVCDNDFDTTMSICRASKNKRRKVKNSEIYTIIPMDKRICLGFVDNPTAVEIKNTFKAALILGLEGIVLYNKTEDRYIKVKDKYTIDVKIIGFNESKAKSKIGMLKEFITEKGKVGSGISRQQCKEFWEKRDELLGTIIEVECMSLTKNGKFRHPRFIRLRPDKS
jgi:hypothetical protein